MELSRLAIAAIVMVVLVIIVFGIISILIVNEQFSYEEIRTKYFSDDGEFDLARDIALAEECRYDKGYGDDYLKWQSDPVCIDLTPDVLKNKYSALELQTVDIRGDFINSKEPVSYSELKESLKNEYYKKDSK